MSKSNKIGNLFGLVLVLILLFSTRSYLGTHPLISAVCFFFFTTLYLFTTIISKEGLFLYPVMFFGALGYFLSLYVLGLPPNTFPAFSVILVYCLFIAIRRLEKQNLKKYSIPLNRGMVITCLIFTIWILWEPRMYFTSKSLIPIITFLGNGVLYYLRSLNVFKRRRLYGALLYLTGAFLALLYWINFIDIGYYGHFLLGFVGLGLYYGTSVHKTKGIDFAFPFYGIGFFIFLISFFYSAQSLAHTCISLLISALVYWGGLFQLRRIKPSRELTRSLDRSLDQIFLLIINLAGAVTLLLFVFKTFPITISGIVSTFLFSLLFFILAFERKRTIIKMRNHYIILSGLFFILFFFLLLFLIRPFSDVQLSLLFSPVLLIILLMGASILQKRRDVIRFRSLMDLNYVILPTVFVLSFLGDTFSPINAAILTALTLIVTVVFMVMRMGFHLLSPMMIIAGYGYYTTLTGLDVDQQTLGILFLPVGLAFMVVTYLYAKKSSPSMNAYYFGWLLFSGISIYLSYPFPVWNIVIFSICAISFLMIGQVLVRIDNRRLVA